jgi:hypothetical protein
VAEAAKGQAEEAASASLQMGWAVSVQASREPRSEKPRAIWAERIEPVPASRVCREPVAAVPL